MKPLEIAALVAAAALLLGGVSLILVAWHHPSDMLSPFMVNIFKTLFVILSGVAGLGSALAAGAYGLGRMHDIRVKYPSEIAAIKQHSPTLAATAFLTGEIALLIVEKTLEGSERWKAVAVGIVILIAIHFANELLKSEDLFRRRIGFAAWFGTLLFVPAAVCVSLRIGFAEAADWVFHLPLSVVAFGVVTILALFYVPFVVDAKGEAPTA